MDRPPHPAPRGDDDLGGAGLSRRLRRALPVAAVAGAAIGAVPAAMGEGWGLIPLGAGAAVALTGTILAAVEDGRVQRRVDRTRRGR